MNNDEDISQQPGVETDVSAVKKNHPSEALMKARQLKSDRKRALAERARLLQQKKREKSDEDAEQESKFNKPKADEKAEKSKKHKLLAIKMREALAKKRTNTAKVAERFRLAREEKKKKQEEASSSNF
ncbi:hypothetical protein CRE_21358 [Caenorhabditis remanei]|uniref:Uncharacterized protein n=1 Tax=Caenorhabditis remanei TaxID=31234 RepID=E3MUX1_CAERE|nr:hypothetical protein CRE_21358 [Caenorhabditis remanei]